VGRVGYDPARPPLHAEQEFVFAGPPPRAGTVLQARSRVESIEEKPSRRYGSLDYVTIVTELRDSDGRVVGSARTTSVAQK
jgi:acyl dehydratase